MHTGGAGVWVSLAAKLIWEPGHISEPDELVLDESHPKGMSFGEILNLQRCLQRYVLNLQPQKPDGPDGEISSFKCRLVF